MKYIIIEDEEFARENLKDIVEKVRPDYELTAMLSSVDESIKFLESENVDMAFMDIDLGDGTCFDIIRNTDIKIPIIFTTAYNEYAIEAFKTNSIDYLLKPITEEDVEHSLRKLDDMADIFRSDGYRTILPKKEKIDRILIAKNKSFSFINISDIAFFCIEDRYVVAYTNEGNCEITEIANMEKVMDLVTDHDFFQLSRSMISSIKAINNVTKIDNQRLYVTVCAGDKKKEVIISALRRKDFLNWLGH
ncbi:LytR/AlgR family response regulator transcription factor [Xylanibacter rarus]|jgi:two-component system, LytTR family, response regulator LytT|uniref:Response regulatory domain-containing protein n=1 Tax=Xylanibacter rarus TaxID=1676614 RepID=A0A8E1QWD8_9BACT|nr:LytTR family DNA-binding domain-containing protein [Xylanibacter rarus]KOO67840.1 hypothetical protein ACU52_11135 [Xylanibacter rarus]